MKLKHNPTTFLKLVVYLIGLVVIGLYLLVIPWISNQVITPYIAYILYPVIVLLILTGIPFYFALFNTLKLLRHIDNNCAFSNLSVSALKNIKYCAISISILYLLSIPFLYVWADKSDAPGIILIGLIILFSSAIIATFATILQKLLKDALEIKKDNDLTI